MSGRSNSSPRRKHRFTPRLETVEARTVPAAGFRAIPDDAVAVSPDDGGVPRVKIIDPATGEDVAEVQAYEDAFRGGVRTALGDVTGDGIKDLVIAPGLGGGPRVQIVDGATGDQIANFFVYEPSFTGGLYVAVGDVNNDGRGDILTGTGNGGGPRVRVLDGATLGQTVLEDFFAYEDTFRGGVLVASGDVNGDGRDDIITGTGVGGGPRVIAFDRSGSVLQNFFAYEDSFRGGVLVSAGDVDGDGDDDIITGTGPGGGPVVRVVGGDDLHELRHFLADDAGFRGGVRVEAEDVNHDGRDDVITHTRHGGRDDVRMFDDDDDRADGTVTRVVDDNPNAGADDNTTPLPTTPVTPTPNTELEGAVTAVDVAAGTVTIAGTVVRTNAATRIERNGVHVTTVAAFQVGDRAEALIGTDGFAVKLEARTVAAGVPAPVTEVEGLVTAIDTAAGTITIGGTVVRVNAATRIERSGDDDTAATLADFRVGDRAEARIGADGFATELEGRTETSGSGSGSGSNSGPGSGSSGSGSGESGDDH
jgi:hypothetical protein